MVDVNRILSEAKTPRSGNTLSWGVGTPSKSADSKMTMAMKVYVPWWKRKPLWYLSSLVIVLLVIQIDVDHSGVLWNTIKSIFNWVRTQPWLTAAIGGSIGYFVRDRAIQLISRHEIIPKEESK